MATTQMVRQKQTQLTTTINKAQSLHLVQTMLHGALSSLTWIRGVFPDKAFVERYYETRQTPLPYADFAAGQMPAENIDTKSSKVYVLQRDCSKRVDNFLDWLVSDFASEIHQKNALTSCRRAVFSQRSLLASYAQSDFSSILM